MAIVNTIPVTYNLYSTLTGEYIESLPFRGVTFGSGPVNQYGTWTGNLDIQDPGIGGKFDWIHSTAPTYATLIVDYEGIIMWGGVMTGRKESFGPNGFQLELDAQEGWGWWNQQMCSTDYSSPPYSGITGSWWQFTQSDGVTVSAHNTLTSVAGAFTQQMLGLQVQLDVSDSTSYRTIIQVNSATELTYNGSNYGANTGLTYSIINGMPFWNYRNGGPDFNGTTYVPVGNPPVQQPYIWDPMLIGAQLIYDCLQVPSQNIWGGMEIHLNGHPVNGTFANGFTDIDWGEAYTLNTGGNANQAPTPVESFISINFPYTSLQTIGAMLGQLTALGYGIGWDGAIDFHYRTPLVPESGIVGVANLCYPQRGVAVGEFEYLNDAYNKLSFNFNRGQMWGFPEDGTAQASTMYETGGNQDIVVVQNVYVLQDGYPNTAKVINVANLNSPNPTVLLKVMGNSDLVLFSWPVVAPDVTFDMFDSGGVGIEQFVIGEQMILIIPQFAQDGGVFDPRFVDGLDTVWRIVSYAATVGDSGMCTLAISLDTPTKQVRTSSTIPTV